MILSGLKKQKNALEKQIPKKATEKTTNRGIDISGEYDIDFDLCCPICGAVVGTFEEGVNEYFSKYCDNCGKRMQDKAVIKDNDPWDYCYGECKIEISIGLQGIYEVGFDEICHECQKRIEIIDMDDFHTMFIENLMGVKRSDNLEL